MNKPFFVSKVIIHIGYPKTATTWLQEKFFPHVTNYHFVSWREANRLIYNSDCFAFNTATVREELLQNAVRNLLVSSEFFSTAINSGFNYGYLSYGISHKLKATFSDATIIIFIRRQQSLIASAYQQYIKNGGTFSFKRWLYSGEVFSFEHLLYDNLISHYISLFGQEQVKVYLYEDFKADNHAFLKKFCSELGLDLDWNKVVFTPTNLGLRRGCMILLKLVNYFYKKPVGRKRFVCHIPGMTKVGRGVIKYLNPLPVFGRYLREDDFLKQNDLEYIKNFYAEHNHRLTKYFPIDVLKKHGYLL